MITSALIDQCRREFHDVAKSTRVTRTGDGASTLYNLRDFPVIESSYSLYVNDAAQTEVTNYSIDLDNGDVQFVTAPPNGQEVRSQHKFAHWRNRHWVEAINQGIQALNARGFFKQVVRNTSLFAISANVRVYSGPSNGIDVYEILKFSTRTISGDYERLPGNWQYQQDANKIVLGWLPSVAEKAAISYLRNLQAYSATSATLDVLDDWIELVKKKAGAIFYRSVAGKVAKQGNATIDEGHFSFTNLRAMARDLDEEFTQEATRKKPTRPAKEIQWHIAGGGV